MQEQLASIGYRLGTPEGVEYITTLLVLRRERALFWWWCGLQFVEVGSRTYVVDGNIARRVTSIPLEERAKKRTSRRKPSRFIRRAA